MDAQPPDRLLKSEEPDDTWCSINEAARRLGVTPTAIRNRVKRGTLPTRPNGNFGKLVKVAPRTVTPTPGEPVTGTVTGTDAEPVPLTVILAALETLKAALAKADAAAERGRLAEVEAAAVPALRDTIAVLKAALTSEQSRNADLQAELAAARRPWWRWWRGVAND